VLVWCLSCVLQTRLIFTRTHQVALLFDVESWLKFNWRTCSHRQLSSCVCAGLAWSHCATVVVLCLLLLSLSVTHTHPFNGPLSGTARVSWYQKGKTSLDSTEARDSEWQWHQLGHMQVCTSLQTDSHASTPPLSFFRLDALPDGQPTASKH